MGAQELLLMMEEHWRRTPELQGVPIYQVSGLARKACTSAAVRLAAKPL